jgi:hypothetical protein
MRTRLTTTEARQATTVRGMLPVLVVSTIGAFIALAGLYLYYFWMAVLTSQRTKRHDVVRRKSAPFFASGYT